MRTGSASHPRLPGRGAGLHPKAAWGWGDAETPELMLLQQARGKTGASSELLEEKKKLKELTRSHPQLFSSHLGTIHTF